LVLADNLFLMFVGWEGVGLCSYLLIGFWFTDIEKARSGKKAFIVNRIGDLGFVIGLMMIWGMLSYQDIVGANVFNFEVLERNAAFVLPLATPICLALFAGAIGKSAQIPLYIWLPDAMAGPTPVSALIHAATMVTAGVYMVARLNFLFVLSPVAMEAVAFIGAATAIFAATIGIVQRDIKKVLAYSTISQIGYMFLAEGVGAFSAGIYHLITHSFFKAALFLGAGSIIHALHGEKDMFNMGGLKKRLPGTCIAFIAAAAAISGIWPLSGFFSKDEIIWEVYSKGDMGLFAIAFITSGMTAFYVFRAVALVFFGKSRLPEDKLARVEESSISMLVPVVLLAILSVAGGLLMTPIFNFIEPRFVSSMAEQETSHHGMKHIVGLISTLWSVHWAFVAWIIYVQKPSWPVAIAQRFGKTYKLLVNKYYIDEIYRLIFVRPLYWISDRVLLTGIDSSLIDKVGVEGSVRSVGLFGDIVVKLQSGAVSGYLFWMVIGLSAFIVLIVF